MRKGSMTMDERQILSRDLMILEAMVMDLDAYLMSESMWWMMAHSDIPRLTLGGVLMRRHRLLVLKDQLESDEQNRLQTALEQFEQVLDEKVIRFEYRAHQELRARMSEWAGHLRELKSNVMAEIENYANVVDTRVVITATLDKLQEPPYRPAVKIAQELAQLDQNLRNRWHDGDFIWPQVWKPAYPREKYWYLYGRRKQVSE